MLPPTWRREAVAALGETFDLIVLGGGVNGCGILLEAAQRGLSVLLVEKADVASGTSSRSSKLIHGGLRYLRQMQFQITRESCRERDRMLHLNPDLVRPLRFIYPSRKGDAVPGWSIELGLKMYDRLTRRVERHSRLDAAEVRETAPDLDLDDLDRALAYSDGWADDARLTLAVAATGWAYGGRLLTRAEVLAGIFGTSGRVEGVVVRDLETGSTRRIRGHVVVNATGVWVDELRGRFGLEGRRVRPSRGAHLVLSRDRLRLSAALASPSPDDGRPVFWIPHPEGVLVGTTDLYHDGPLDDPRASREEVDYLLRATRGLFPTLELGEADVVGAFAGLRPILEAFTERGESPSEASREEAIWEERGILSVAGGKLTTWRITAEEAVDAAVELLPDERRSEVGPSASAGTTLVGLAPSDLAARLEGPQPLPAGVAAALARRLRALAPVALRLARTPEELTPLVDGTDLTAAEVRAHLAFGGVLRLEDLLLRRARFGLWNPAVARALLPRLRTLFAEELGWDAARWGREEEAFDLALEGWTPAGVEGQHPQPSGRGDRP